MEKDLDRLPLTAKALSEHVESFEDHLIRKVEWAEVDCRRKGILPTRHQFEVHAGIRGRAGRTQKVAEAVNTALNRLAGQLGFCASWH